MRARRRWLTGYPGSTSSRRAARKAQEERYYQQFSFKPAINPRSQQLAEVQPLLAMHAIFCQDIGSLKQMQAGRCEAFHRHC